MQRHPLWPVLLTLATLVASLNACRPQTPGVPPADREAVAALVREVDAAYGVQDAARFSAAFAEDANFQFPVEGLVMSGREEIRKHFAGQFATSPPLRHVTTTGDVAFVGSGILAVDIQVDILAVDAKTGATRPLFHYAGLSLGIHVGSEWRIRLVRLFPVVK